MKGSNKTILLALSAGLLLVSCFAFWFVYKEVSANKSDADAKLTAWEGEEARRAELKLLDKILKEIDPEIKSLNTHFAESTNVVPFLDTIEKTAQSVGLKAEISTVDVAKDMTSLSLGVQAKGSFEAVYKFILLLENSPYEMEMTSLNITKDAGEESNTWSATIRLKLLSFLK